jgi:hypothetical protein
MPAQKTQERRNASEACECMHGVGGVHISNILDTHVERKSKSLIFDAAGNSPIWETDSTGTFHGVDSRDRF